MNVASIIAMLCITILVTTALVLGYDGVLLAGACTVIAGLGGVAIKRKVKPE